MNLTMLGCFVAAALVLLVLAVFIGAKRFNEDEDVPDPRRTSDWPWNE